MLSTRTKVVVGRKGSDFENALRIQKVKRERRCNAKQGKKQRNDGDIFLVVDVSTFLCLDCLWA